MDTCKNMLNYLKMNKFHHFDKDWINKDWIDNYYQNNYIDKSKNMLYY